MEDRELIEWAAKAAGIEGTWDTYAECFVPKVGQMRWNPLTNDGDAFRLAVTIAGNGWAFSYLDEATTNGSPVWLDSADPNAATRRAIVLAAAKIGKEMK